MISFRQWCKQKSIILKPWQQAAADAFFILMRPHRGSGTGKSYLIRAMYNFTNECGNRMMLDSEVAVEAKKRGKDHVRDEDSEAAV